MRSLSRHVDDTVSGKRAINDYIIVFTETQFNPSDSTCKIIKTLTFFNIKSQEAFADRVFTLILDVVILTSNKSQRCYSWGLQL